MTGCAFVGNCSPTRWISAIFIINNRKMHKGDGTNMRLLTTITIAIMLLGISHAGTEEDLAKVKAAIEQLKKANPKQKGWDNKVTLSTQYGSISLKFNSCDELTDIGPLNGMPLVSLDLNGTKVSDISALKGMPLKKLDLWGTPVSDISALKGMPLTTLLLWGAPVSDISVLKGMPLKTLVLTLTEVKDISVLKGMPLILVFLPPKPKDISVLKGMSLRSVYLPSSANDIEFLRLTPLEYINMKPAAQFWKEYDAKKAKKQ